MAAFIIHPEDNVATALEDLDAGSVSLQGETAGRESVKLQEAIQSGHKVALRDIAEGEPVVKYGVAVGHASRAIQSGQWVHLHNVASAYDERAETLDVETGAPADTPYQ